MSTTIRSGLDEPSDPGSAGAERSEPVGRAQRRAGAARRQSTPRAELAEEVKALLPDGLIDELLAGARTEEEIAGPGGLLGQLTKRLVERAMEVELTDHLGYEPHQEPPGGAGNTRNGSMSKTLLTKQGAVQIDTPRDGAGTLSRRSSASVSGVSRGSTTRSLPCFAGPVDRISRRTWRRSTASGWPRPDLAGDRRGHGRRSGLATRRWMTSIRSCSSTAGAEDPRRRLGSTACLLPGDGDRDRR